MNETSSRTIKVAVIGSGLAGLTAAYLLTKSKIVSSVKDEDARFEVHLFERSKTLGMDAASISVGPRSDLRIDVPMRSFMSGYYSHLFKLYRHLNVPLTPTKFSFSWYRIGPSQHVDEKEDRRTSNQPYLSYSGSRTVGLLGCPRQKGASFIELISGWWSTLLVAGSYLWVMTLALWMHNRGHLRNPEHPVSEMTLEQWLKKQRVHPYFVHEVFVPLFAAVCTNSWRSMLEYPAAEVLEYLAMGFSQESFVVKGGVRNVVGALSASLNHVHLDTNVISIQPSTTQNKYQLCDENGQEFAMDHIIFATQGNQALRMLDGCHRQMCATIGSPDNARSASQERFLQNILLQMNALQQFHYEESMVVNHTDIRLLPSNRHHWKTLNLAKLDQSVQPVSNDCIISFPHDTTMTTHILSLTHQTVNIDDTLYLQTTNPCIAPDPNCILSISKFERATVTMQSKKVLQEYFFKPHRNGNTELGQCQGSNKFWFIGSYCWRGIPLLEGCVASAEKVIVNGIAPLEGLAIELPW